MVLAGSMLSNFLGAKQLSDTVVRGQSDTLFYLLYRYTPPGPPAPDESAMRRAFDEGQELGLTYAALVGPDGPVVEVGTSSRDVTLREASSEPAFEPFGDVFRAWAQRPPRPERPRLDSKGPPLGARRPRFEGLSPLPQPPGADMGPPGDATRPRTARRPPPRLEARFMIEFVPTQAQAMAERARTDLFVGLGSIVVLWVGALAFWKLSRRASAAESELTRKHHLAALGEMSAVIAHELRNPLASLKGHAQLLYEQTSDTKMQRKARRVVDEAVRLQALTNGLLDFVRSGRVQPDTTAIAELVRESVAGTLASVTTNLEDAPSAWNIDRVRMRQVLMNLLDNAHHAAPEAEAELVVRVEEGQLVIEVHDRGPGVPEEKRSQVFEAFHTGRTQGTGLGLAVCRRIVQEHGGSIRCDDHPDGGALFTVRIP